MIPPAQPVLGLRMKTPAPSDFSDSSSCHHVETVQAMMRQDAAYRCEDYLARLAPSMENKESSRCSPSHVEDTTTTAIDAVCREKMA